MLAERGTGGVHEDGHPPERRVEPWLGDRPAGALRRGDCVVD